MRTPPISRGAGLAAALALTAALASCGGTSSDDSDVAAAAAPEAAGSVADTATGTDTGAAPVTGDAGTVVQSGNTAAGTGAATSPGAATGSAPAAGVPADIAAGADRKTARGVSVPDAALTGRDVIYTADLTVQVDDVTHAVAQIETAVRAAGGFVAGSERSTDAASIPAPQTVEPGAEPAPAPRSSATMTLRVPPGGFNSVLDRLATLGLVLDRKLTGQDVTETVVDVKSRIASARASVDRIRDLMERAVTLRDVVALEGELSQREADLDALLAKQTSLKDQTSLATVTVHLKTAEALAATAEDDDEGFTAGLSNGWDAFTTSATAGATVLGALVPFAAALLLLGPPLWWLGLRIQRTAPTLRRKVSPTEPS